MSDFCPIEKKNSTIIDDFQTLNQMSPFFSEAKKVYEEFENNNSSSYAAQELKKIRIAIGIARKFFIENGSFVYDRREEFPLVYSTFVLERRIPNSTDVSLVIERIPSVDFEKFQSFIYEDDTKIDEKNCAVFLNEYEKYLRRGGRTLDKSGNFCSVFPDFFNKIKAFSNAFANLLSIADSLKNETKKYSNPSALNSISLIMKQTVSSIFEDKRAQIESFKASSILPEDSVLNPHSERVLQRFHTLKNKAEDTYSKQNEEIVQKKIDGVISYSISLFDEKKIEEIEYLIYRFCNALQNFELETDNSMLHLKNMVDSQNTLRTALKSSSSISKARAINAGAFRYSPDEQSEKYKSSYQKVSQEAENRGNSFDPSISPGDADNVTQWNDGKGDNRISFQGGWVSKLGRIGWDKVDIRVKVRLMKLQQKLGRKLIVNSGYRSPAYNASLKGAAKNSYHMRGEAVDITWNGYRSSSIAERQQFIEAAYSCGFSGIGKYSGFIHIDIGPKRTWGKF